MARGGSRAESALSFDKGNGDARHAGEAWASFYLEQRPALTAYALALTGNTADAADLLQDVLLRLIRERATARDRRAYVLRCLRNAAIDFRRRRALRDGRAGAALEPAYLADAAEADRAERQQDVRAALRRLSAEQHEAIVLRVFCNVTFAEAAEILGRPIGTIASDYSRGLTRLRQLLSTADDERDRAPTPGRAGMNQTGHSAHE